MRFSVCVGVLGLVLGVCTARASLIGLEYSNEESPFYRFDAKTGKGMLVAYSNYAHLAALVPARSRGEDSKSGDETVIGLDTVPKMTYGDDIADLGMEVGQENWTPIFTENSNELKIPAWQVVGGTRSWLYEVGGVYTNDGLYLTDLGATVGAGSVNLVGNEGGFFNIGSVQYGDHRLYMVPEPGVGVMVVAVGLMGLARRRGWEGM